MIGFNPVLTRELVTSLRARKSFSLQLLFVASLAGLVYLAWPSVDEFSTEKAKTLGVGLFNLFAKGSLVMIAMLAPAFSAGSITVEKEKRTLDLLLTAPVTINSIVAGKLMASLTYLLLLLVSTVPVLSLCYLLPGNDPSAIPALYLILGTVALTFGMIGLTASAFLDRTQASLAITYLLVLPLTVALLLVAHFGETWFFKMDSAVLCVIVGTVGNLMLYGAVTRRMKKPFNPVPRSADQEDVSRQAGLVLIHTHFPDNLLVPDRTDQLMPDGANPVREKELCSEVFGSGTLFMRLIVQISMVLSIPFILFLYSEAEYIFVGYLVVFAMLVGPAFSCNAFTQERERATLSMLLTTLVTPRQLLLGKLSVSIRHSVILTGFLAISLGIAAGFGRAFGPYRVELLGYTWVVLVTIVSSALIATFFSLILDTTLVSMVTTYTAVLLLYLAPLVVEAILYQFTDIQEGRIVWYTFTSPLRAAMSVNQWGDGGARMAHALPPVWIAFSAFYLALDLLLLGILYAGVRRMLRLK